jgi:hydroxypyruvate isomerase
MIKLCAHLGYQFGEVSFLERFALAAAAGYRAVEIPAPYAFDVDMLAEHLERFDLTLVQIGTPTGAVHEKGLAALPRRESEFRKGLAEAIRYARALGCSRVHPMAGLENGTPAANWGTYVSNMKLAVDLLGEEGITTLVEVMSPGAVPDYFMSSYTRARELFDAVADPRLTLLFDTYHAQVLTGDAPAELARWIGRIGHIQIADHPGRHEPGTGELDFPAMFASLEHAGYAGWLGCEYRPETTTAEGLRYLAPYLSGAQPGGST